MTAHTAGAVAGVVSSVPLAADLTKSDRIVLSNLFRDLVRVPSSPLVPNPDNAAATALDLSLLAGLNDPTSPNFTPTVFTTYDAPFATLPSWVAAFVEKIYVPWARTVVRNESDVVFLTHLIFYSTTLLPSAIGLFWHFSWAQVALHAFLLVGAVGPFTLMLHNHSHNSGVLHAEYRLLDTLLPCYVLCPLIGHTWNSYYYHHAKMHHVEGNGPQDLSSTLRFQRDSFPSFLSYLYNFLLFEPIELPLYFIRKGRYSLAFKSAFWDCAAYAAYAFAVQSNRRAGICVFVLPMIALRCGLMVGNWGQHALIDHDEPTSDLRSSITLLDPQSNRYSFNDGYHTSHHLNPRRHWSKHPHAFLSAKKTYGAERAIVLHDVDYIMLSVRLWLGHYEWLGERIVRMGAEQRAMGKGEVEDMLRRATRRFSEEEIREKFSKKGRDVVELEEEGED